MSEAAGFVNGTTDRLRDGAGRHPDLVLGAVLTAALCTVAFIAGGGTNVGANTSVQIGQLAVGAAVLVGLLIAPVRTRRWGVGALVLFGALAALTYASLAWSVTPGASWLEANRTLSYFASFATMLALARMAPGRWRAVIAAVALSATVVAAYALVVKVFPNALDPGDPLGRLNAPLGYWNAVGITAAMGIPACLWLGAAPHPWRWLRILAPPAIALLISAVLMSESRGALLVLVIGLVVWFAVVPLRLRALATLALGGAGTVAISVAALSNGSISNDNVVEHARVIAGHSFGIVLVVDLILTCGAAVVLAVAMDRVVLAPRLRHRIGTVLVVAAALVPVAGIVGLAASSRGLTGEISHAWSTVTNPNGGVANQASRLLNLSNNRTTYWGDGLKVAEHHLAAGVGAFGYSVAYQRYSKTPFPVLQAHSYAIQTFADFGLIGVAIGLGLLLAWLTAAGRALGARARKPLAEDGGPPSAERAGLLTLASVVLVYGLHSLIDWDWFIPGTTVIALGCAGWLAGRGPLAGSPAPSAERRSLTRSPAVGMAAVGVVAALLALGWMLTGPLRSLEDDSAAATALSQGQSGQALTDARAAVAADPLALEPLYELAAIETARGELQGARSELLKAVANEPANPSPWQQLASFDISRRRARAALTELARARVLYPPSTVTDTLIAQANAELPHRR